uniref:Uncharacterized protein n=1 Tax=Avena sativa TaxID=4498 RepID=A0ACD5TEV2_AVESA
MHLAEPIGDYGDGGDTTNLVPSLAIFYVMVLGQRILYILPCILQVFSFILRRSLVRRAGLRGEWGVESVDLYYLYAFEKHMEGGILSAKNISIITFAVESLKSDTPKMQLLGVQMLHSFLKKEPLKAMTISKLTDSTKTVTSLLKMLGWTSQGQRDIRYFAAKVLAELAVSLRVLPTPGAIWQIASLLNTIHPMEIQSPLLHNYRQEAKQEAPIQDADRLTPELKFWKQMIVYCLIPVEEPSKLVDKQHSYILKCWKNITKCYSVPEEDQSADHDLLPVLGMLTLERLANFDTENCMEISRAAGLISMIIEFTSNNRTDLTNINQTHRAMLKGSSLKVLRRLTSTEGRSGVKLRHGISEHPFLLRNLAQILDDDDGSSQELRELTAEILRNLAMDETTREEIGCFRVIIRSLMRAFLSRAVTDSDELLQIVAGQALAVLATESPNNCLAMSEEPGYVFIKELTTMIHIDRYRYIAASLLRNMCVHARSKLGKADLEELSHILPKVLEGIINTDGAELEVLVGLSSQICIAIPGHFARELERGQNKERFIKRLVNSLNANMGTAAHCPGVRRAVVEQAVCMMECDPAYTECFIKCGMGEALVMVEHKHFRAENYRYFSGDVGLIVE